MRSPARSTRGATAERTPAAAAPTPHAAASAAAADAPPAPRPVPTRPAAAAARRSFLPPPVVHHTFIERLSCEKTAPAARSVAIGGCGCRRVFLLGGRLGAPLSPQQEESAESDQSKGHPD